MVKSSGWKRLTPNPDDEITTKESSCTLTPEDLRYSDYRWISTVHSLKSSSSVRHLLYGSGEWSLAIESPGMWQRAEPSWSLQSTVEKSPALGRFPVESQQPAVELIHPLTPIKRQPHFSAPKPKLLAAQFRILTDQILAKAVYQDQD